MNVYVVSLGCPKNRTDTEAALGTLKDLDPGLEIVEKREEADLILVNTCSFIQEAVEESIETILDLALKKADHQKIAVMGCLYKRYGEELKKELPEVDIFLGNEVKEGDLAPLFEVPPPHTKDSVTPPSCGRRILTTPPWRAYVKIVEGCSHKCTYCLIPTIRGPRRPRPLPEILDELKGLSDCGVKEVTLVGQDLTSWEWEGLRLADLVERVDMEVDIPWIRLLYLHPTGVDQRLLEAVSSGQRILNYLDIPIQHASSTILKRMGRPYDLDFLRRLFGWIREKYPWIVLRTTVMVGFPGETDDDLETLLAFMKEVEFHHLGCFRYSDEEEAPSHAFRYKVSKSTARARQMEVLELQNSISRRHLRQYVGQCLEVLIEGYSKETDLLLEGRTAFQAPGVDGAVYINEGTGEPGKFFNVEIRDSFDYELLGRIKGPLAEPAGQSVQSSYQK